MKYLISPLVFSLLTLSVPAYAGVLQTTPLVDVETRQIIANSTAIFERTSSGVSIDLQTSELPEGAYTVWVSIFNNPLTCFDSCDVEDLRNPSVNASFFWIDGGIVDSDGIGNFNAQILLDRLPTLPDQVRIGNQGLVNPFSAEIHTVLRWHGPVIPDLITQQTTTFNGGCSTQLNDGLFACNFRQFAIDPPIAAVPESSFLLSLIIFGVLGVTITLKRNLKL